MLQVVVRELCQAFQTADKIFTHIFKVVDIVIAG